MDVAPAAPADPAASVALTTELSAEFSALVQIAVPQPPAPPQRGTSTALATWNGSSWRSQAACSEMDTSLFFPVGEGYMATDQIRLAKSICAGCSVRNECLEFAIRTIQNDGVWGGTTEEERRVIKRSRRNAARRAQAARARAEADDHAEAS